MSSLASIEEMAGLDILCSDKTGTLKRRVDEVLAAAHAGV